MVHLLRMEIVSSTTCKFYDQNTIFKHTWKRTSNELMPAIYYSALWSSLTTCMIPVGWLNSLMGRTKEVLFASFLLMHGDPCDRDLSCQLHALSQSTSFYLCHRVAVIHSCKGKGQKKSNTCHRHHHHHEQQQSVGVMVTINFFFFFSLFLHFFL